MTTKMNIKMMSGKQQTIQQLILYKLGETVKESYNYRIVAKQGSFRKVTEMEMDDLNRQHSWRKTGTGKVRGCRLQRDRECSDWIYSCRNRKNLIASEEYGYWDTKRQPGSLCKGYKVYLFPTDTVVNEAKKLNKEVYGWVFEVEAVRKLEVSQRHCWWGDFEMKTYDDLLNENTLMKQSLRDLATAAMAAKRAYTMV